MQNTLEVCLTPSLYPHILNKSNYAVIIIDVLRASTSICTAFKNGVNSIIPIGDIEEAREYKNKGYIVAAERNGLKIDFADIGNSPFNFTEELVKGKDIVYSTTNGTQAVKMVSNVEDVIIGCFNNLKFASEWIVSKNKNVLILCSGWKNKFSLEDAVCAGAFIEQLIEYPDFCINCDSAIASLDLWKIAKQDLNKYMEKAMHRLRLKKYGLDDVLDYTFKIDNVNIVPYLRQGVLIV